jgi:hypothetical protein
LQLCYVQTFFIILLKHLSSSNTGKTRLVNSKVMTLEQFQHAEEDLLQRLQAMRETESGKRALMSKSSLGRKSYDPNDDIYDLPISTEQTEAFNEWNSYCGLTKMGECYPNKYKKDADHLKIGDIEFGTVEERGKDMEALPGSSFKKCNLADYITKGYFDLIGFVTFNKQAFPYIYKLTCCLSSLQTNEVGCERFFSIAGYVSNPRRARLNVHHYEKIAMLKRNLQQIYVDEEWIVREYLENEQNKSWDKIQTEQDVDVTHLEGLLYAEELGLSPDQEATYDGHAETIQDDSDSNSDTDSEGG